MFKWRGEKEERSTIVLIVMLCDNLAYDDDTNDIIDITEAVRFDTNIPLSFPDRLHHIGGGSPKTSGVGSSSPAIVAIESTTSTGFLGNNKGADSISRST